MKGDQLISLARETVHTVGLYAAINYFQFGKLQHITAFAAIALSRTPKVGVRGRGNVHLLSNGILNAAVAYGDIYLVLGSYRLLSQWGDLSATWKAIGSAGALTSLGYTYLRAQGIRNADWRLDLWPSKNPVAK